MTEQCERGRCVYVGAMLLTCGVVHFGADCPSPHIIVPTNVSARWSTSEHGCQYGSLVSCASTRTLSVASHTRSAHCVRFPKMANTAPTTSSFDSRARQFTSYCLTTLGFDSRARQFTSYCLTTLGFDSRTRQFTYYCLTTLGFGSGARQLTSH